MNVKRESEAAQSCPTLSDPMDCSLPGPSVHRIFQVRVLKWDAIAFSSVEYYSAVKKNTFESVLMRWLNLEPLIHSNVKSEREIYISYTYTYIWNLERWH